MPDNDNPYAIVPVGAVFPFAGQIDEEKEAKLRLGGWLPCDGRPLRSSDPEFLVLFQVIGTAHGAGFDANGNPAGDFNIPDYRGLFLRGTATAGPGAADRVAMRTGGNQSGLGSVQGFATARPHNHFRTAKDGQHQHLDPTWNAQPGPYELGNSINGQFWGYDYGAQAAPTGGDATHAHTIAEGGDAETRPLNVFVNYIIKFKQV